ncbi:phage tail sheath subtilisin-like domain-containing protein [Zooshikella ganghwensis]|uniref:phage tail sheath subtilisin-like domain-containing protein n=1 Tax=Zooshikella ganghwensis TaxID=202772 RepID=UPI0019805B65|nr:phage tail sheath subtilisin-like domain-containing protein [Zooshikella ganghwensis]
MEIDSGPRPIQTVKSSVIGLVGTAPDAQDEHFPLNTPVLIAGSAREAAKLGNKGTLPTAIKGIFDQIGAFVVVVRVKEESEEAKQISALVGNDQSDPPTGIYALKSAQSAETAMVQPRILIAPGYSQLEPVGKALDVVAIDLNGMAIIDGPNTTTGEAIQYKNKYDSRHAYLIDPWVKVWDTQTHQAVDRPPSPYVAGLMAKIDNDKGFWHSPSNKTIKGIIGTSRPIDFTFGKTNCRANLLNENHITTIINENGYRLWGNRTTCISDPKWAFVNVVRTSLILYDSLLRAHLWAVDRNITRTYLKDVAEGVNNYLRRLKALGAILGGTCYPDEELNTTDNLSAGKVFFNFDFTPPAPAEHITFRSDMTEKYYKDILGN